MFNILKSEQITQAVNEAAAETFHPEKAALRSHSLAASNTPLQTQTNAAENKAQWPFAWKFFIKRVKEKTAPTALPQQATT